MKSAIILAVLAPLLSLANAQVIDTIYVQVDGVNLHTVLSSPDNDTNSPLAIIIAGSGPTDLNGNQPNMQNNSLKYLSTSLVANNIATVRFDKRGIAKSAVSNFDESELIIDLYANDVISLINHYQQKGYSDIYVVGHSEGSLIGLIAARELQIKGFISIAGAGSPADEVLKNQLKPKLPPAYFSQVETIIDSLKNGYKVNNTPPEFNSLFRASVQPYLISWFRYKPTELIGNLDCPVLIVQGDKDLQVNLEEAKKLQQASVNGELLIVSNMNHVLKSISGDTQENVASYMNPDLPINSELVTGIAEFINQ